MATFKEGKVVVKVPDFTKITSKNEVFYNPQMKFNRDISVLLVSCLKEKEILCGMAGSGIKAIRYAIEAEKEVTANDLNPRAVKLIKENAERNGVILPSLNSDFNLVKEKYDVVDVDPFGSPARYLSAAMRLFKRRGYLFVTATDTSALCGSSPRSCIRKYSAYPLKTKYCHEIGLRILIGFVVRQAALWGYGAVPQLCFYEGHYMRAHVKFEKGKRKADRSMKSLGFINNCVCKTRSFSKKPVCVCRCGKKYEHAFPLWGADIKNEELVGHMLDRLDNILPDNNTKIKNFLYIIKNEIDIPFHWDTHEIASFLKIPLLPIDEMIKELGRGGFDSSKTHFSPMAIKTKATIGDMKAIF
ncbi:MAG: tRNA (guanine(10)-N(2))-dimethyltransferase [Candidatus Methanofastidiosia archaeon]